jgi:polysaccharide export outer membrane protein
MMRQLTRLFLLLPLTLSALAGCAPSALPVNQVVPPNLPYVIGPGDTMGIYVFRNPELSTTAVVAPDGRISLPLVPDIVANGKTAPELAKAIEDRLKEYVKEPKVSVIVNGFVGPSSRQVRVIGEATDPVAIPYRDQMTLLDVMIATKGLTRFAAGNRAVIIRRYGGPRQVIPVRLGDLIKDGDIDQNVMMAPGDILLIPQTFF